MLAIECDAGNGGNPSGDNLELAVVTVQRSNLLGAGLDRKRTEVAEDEVITVADGD